MQAATGPAAGDSDGPSAPSRKTSGVPPVTMPSAGVPVVGQRVQARGCTPATDRFRSMSGIPCDRPGGGATSRWKRCVQVRTVALEARRRECQHSALGSREGGNTRSIRDKPRHQGRVRPQRSVQYYIRKSQNPNIASRAPAARRPGRSAPLSASSLKQKFPSFLLRAHVRRPRRRRRGRGPNARRGRGRSPQHARSAQKGGSQRTHRPAHA